MLRITAQYSGNIRVKRQEGACDVQDKLLGVRGEVTAALDALKEGLERRQSVASAKALLELMQDTAHVMSKVCTPGFIMLCVSGFC